ncbi:MAG TPA: rhodanese-like domain-containing protein [Candidatus Acidoferrales bacterium]|nr:rhodanese-like domain-containing protein [Candidatus Acidoferrales bacterium]
MPLPSELSPGEVKRLIDSGHAPILLDVREPEEVELVHITGSLHIPMGEIPGRLHELDPDADIVVYCHHGIRSADVVAFLKRHEFGSVANLSGGIEAWSLQVDRSLPRY